MPAFLSCLVFSNNPFLNDIPIVLSRVQKIDITTSEVKFSFMTNQILHYLAHPTMVATSCSMVKVTELERIGIEEQIFHETKQ